MKQKQKVRMEKRNSRERWENHWIDGNYASAVREYMHLKRIPLMEAKKFINSVDIDKLKK